MNNKHDYTEEEYYEIYDKLLDRQEAEKQAALREKIESRQSSLNSFSITGVTTGTYTPPSVQRALDSFASSMPFTAPFAQLDTDNADDIVSEAINNKTLVKKGNSYIAQTAQGNFTLKPADFALVRNAIAKILLERAYNLDKDFGIASIGEFIGTLDIAASPVYDSKHMKEAIKESIQELRTVIDKSKENTIIFDIAKDSYLNESLESINSYCLDRDEQLEAISSRNNLLFLLFENKILTYEDLSQEGFWDDVAQMDLFYHYERGALTKKQLIYTLSRTNRDESITDLDYIAKLYMDSKNNSHCAKLMKKYFGLFSREEVCELYSKGIFTTAELQKSYVSHKDLLNCSEEVIVSTLKENETYPRSFVPSSDELTDLYIKKLSGKSIISLANKKFINPEKVLELYTYPSAELQSDIPPISLEDVSEFYSSDVLLDLYNSNKLNTQFIKNYSNFVYSKLENKDKVNSEFIEFFKKLEELDKDTYPSKVIELYSKGFIPDELKKEIINDESMLVDLYLNDELDQETIKSLSRDKLVSADTLLDICEDTPLNLYITGLVDESFLLNIPESERGFVLLEALSEGKIEFSTITKFYMEHDGISIDEFKLMYDDSIEKADINVMSDLPENCDKNKIKDLFLNYIISYNDLIELEQNGNISPDEKKDIESALQSQEFFNMFDKQNVNILSTSTQTIQKTSGPKINNPGPHTPKTAKITKASREKYFDEIGNHKKITPIDKITDQGKNYTLYGYSIIPYPDYDLVALEHFDKLGQATFVMDYRQFLFYIHNTKKATTELSTTKTFSGSKAAFRQSQDLGQAIRSRSHFSNWGYSVADAFAELSPVAREVLKDENNKYTEKAEALGKAIRDEYNRNR